MIGVIALWLLLAIGLAIRFAMAALEARHLRWCWDWVCRGDVDSANGHRAVVLNRTYQALSAVRLARLVSLALLVPAAVLLVEHYLQAETIGAAGILLSILLLVVVLFLLLNLVTALLMQGFYSPDRPLTRNASPAWLSTANERPPAPLAAGALLWDWIVRQGHRLTPGRALIRPKARLYELEEDLVMAVGEGELGALETRAAAQARHQRLEPTERDMIHAIHRLDQTLVREVMRPLNKVVAVRLSEMDPPKFIDFARRKGYTRYPCYDDHITNLKGYLNIHDFLEKPNLPRDIRPFVHNCPFVPEVARLNVVLQEMQAARSQVAIAFDEFGGCSGLLSREDIFEEITGEIVGEMERELPHSVHEQEEGYLVHGLIDLDDLREALGLALEKRNADTLAGYLYQRLSRTPREDEVLEDRGWTLVVKAMDAHRVEQVLLIPPKEPEE